MIRSDDTNPQVGKTSTPAASGDIASLPPRAELEAASGNDGHSSDQTAAVSASPAAPEMKTLSSSRGKTSGITRRDPKVEHIPLSKIVFDEGIQVRAEIDAKVVTKYAADMENGDPFPPLDVFSAGDGTYLLADGHHRAHAAEKNGVVNLHVRVHEGSRSDAIKFALQSNNLHGQPRTTADKRRAIRIALTEFSNWSDREVARICAVSDKTVGNVRHEIAAEKQSEPGDSSSNCGISAVAVRQGKDGKVRKMPGRRTRVAESANGADETTTSTSTMLLPADQPESALAAVTRALDPIDVDHAEFTAVRGYVQTWLARHGADIPCSSQNVARSDDANPGTGGAP